MGLSPVCRPSDGPESICVPSSELQAMKAERTDRMTNWNAQPFEEGYDGLRSLVERDFSGAVTDGFAWAILVNGRIVGVFDGDIDAFENADGTAYVAPEPEVALLFAMQEMGGESRAQYYTEETPIETVDDTLSDGGFTGYIELSENVLSGDYYVVYSGGKSTGVAFVGNAETLHTGSDAFERAADEVGIYEVYDVDLDIVDIPDSIDSARGGAAAAGEDVGDVDESTQETETESATDPDAAYETGETSEAKTKSGTEESSESDDTRDSDRAIGSTDTTEPPSDQDAKSDFDTQSGSDTTGDSARAFDSDTDNREPTGESGSISESAGRDESAVDPVGSNAISDAEATEPDSKATQTGTSTREPGSEHGESPRSSQGTNARAGSARTGENVFSEEAAWRQAQTIPALDPSNSTDRVTDSGRESQTTPRSGDSADSQADPGARRGVEGSNTESSRHSSRTGNRSTERSDDSAESTTTASAQAESSSLDARIEELESALETESRRKASLESTVDSVTAERDEYKERASELESKIQELETELESLRAERSANGEPAHAVDRTMDPEKAIAGTNLFVRYASKGKTTLKKVHAGDATREELTENLQLEHHTSFDDSGLAVSGDSFQSFLEETVEYTFAEWVVTDLPFEIRETGNVSRLRDLYDSIAAIDRIEFAGRIEIESDTADDAAESRSLSFDVVFRDRMGDPLLVSNINDSRDPTTGSMVDTLVSDGSTVATRYDDFAGALSVTASFFDPDALDAAADATGGGLLSRNSRASYVKLSRKTGFHLCLIETREGGFHLTVPEI